MMKCFYETLGRQDDWDEEQVLQSQPYCQPCIVKTCNVHHFPEKFWVKFVKILSPLRSESGKAERRRRLILSHTDLDNLNRYSSYAAVQKALCAVQSSISLRPFKESISFLWWIHFACKITLFGNKVVLLFEELWKCTFNILPTIKLFIIRKNRSVRSVRSVWPYRYTLYNFELNL